MSSPMPVTELTLRRVRRDCARNAKGRPFISAFALFLALIGAGFTARYLDGDHHDFLIAGLILFAAAAGISLLGRLFALRMNKKLSSGEIRFIRSCVDDMKLDGADDEWGKVYLHFSLGPDGRYISRTSVRGDKVKLGEPYYLVLDKDRKGKLYVLAFYSAQEFQPDAQLRELLVRDVRLTGEQISREALQKRETRARLEKLTASHKECPASAKNEDSLPGDTSR